MRPAKVTTLRIIHYEPDESNPPEWYNPDYSWYCTGIAMRHKIDRHDSGMYYAEGDTSDFDLDSDLEPEPEIQAFITKPIDKNTSTSEIEDIYYLYRNI
ncbi:9369_t:CDS:2 [Acaulospora colombiana]|uniref:9369_t:CDS:1 n=1 Tax=Acaulospora colombiana TaxID=27376 RepID=A0ACA9LUS6_9GLOM|nr:9369_t:CDS:2 [Acaulospora colombiana]